MGLKKNFPIFAVPYPWDQRGGLAQLVEHRTENPCVPGSSPGSTTTLEFKALLAHARRALFVNRPFDNNSQV